ncbi:MULTISPECIES: AraC family transcriptional regulator [Bacillota]|uniref:Putative transcriptional regulator (AraC/XylS family) n=1 Tax=[Clostridium] ultunense Esp TaxID=1288971 RepID=A0A1M4PQ11_9FIRM|nr:MULTISPECIES: AraC family transcriptional regulator [Bacillota]MCF6462915.1 AraC family transcriptional regulator [Clostridium sp. Cult1]SHD77564.1 putative transcriptional regulator (AraC/XylS family) [[Clostridium] ultunense Esp]
MLNELNHVIDYIEERLTDDLSLEEISEYAGVSDYHFRKIFFYISGLTLSEYIKNRRLSEASMDLLHGEKVTDVAFKYGYQSIDGFTRAFKKWSGFLPSEVIKKGISKTFPKLSFVITVKGGINMEFRIEEKPAFNLVGVSKRVPMQFEGVNNEIVKLAESITDEQREEMHSLQNMEPYEIVNASYEADANFLKEEGDLTHLIGVLTTENQVSDLLEKVPVDAYTWAVFPNEGPFPSTLQETMAKVYSEWLPSSNYEVINAPAFSFTKMDKDKKDYAYSEVWIPVRRKTK